MKIDLFACRLPKNGIVLFPSFPILVNDELMAPYGRMELSGKKEELFYKLISKVGHNDWPCGHEVIKVSGDVDILRGSKGRGLGLFAINDDEESTVMLYSRLPRYNEKISSFMSCAGDISMKTSSGIKRVTGHIDSGTIIKLDLIITSISEAR